VTTTTSPCVQNREPSYHGTDDDPLVKPPPWIHTITGRFAASQAGVCTLSVRQSSLQSGTRPPPARLSMAPGTCGATGPNRVASRTPDHAATGCGAPNRPAPIGVAAYGMPANSSAPPRSRPSMRPPVVSTS
jgi:hypothetical protein